LVLMVMILLIINLCGLPINYEGRHIDKINNNTLLIVGNNNKAFRLNLDEK